MEDQSAVAAEQHAAGVAIWAAAARLANGIFNRTGAKPGDSVNLPNGVNYTIHGYTRGGKPGMHLRRNGSQVDAPSSRIAIANPDNEVIRFVFTDAPLLEPALIALHARTVAENSARMAETIASLGL